jgi:hypothetical protein
MPEFVISEYFTVDNLARCRCNVQDAINELTRLQDRLDKDSQKYSQVRRLLKSTRYRIANEKHSMETLLDQIDEIIKLLE